MQENRNSVPLYKKLDRNDFLIGNYQNSYAIPYSPEKFSKWMNNNNIFSLFIHDSIKQALINNRKFIHILSLSDNLNIRLVDCEFDNIELDTVLEGEELESDIILHTLENKSYRLLKISFRSRSNFLISIKRNGVLEIDERALEFDRKVLQDLLDTLNLGYGVIM